MSAHSRLLTVLAACAALSGPALGGAAALEADTSLREAPDGTRIAAMLTAGTAVEVLEESGGWARVRVEGWVRADALQTPSVVPSAGAATGASAAVEAAPPAAVAASAAAPQSSPAPGGVTIEGHVRVKLGRFKEHMANRDPVMLLPAGVELAARAPNAEIDRQLAELESQAARLKREAERAMQGSNFYQSTTRRDELMRERDVLLAQRQDILGERYGRTEAEARTVAVATTSTDSRGWFTLGPVPPGAYKVYARLTRDDLDVEWWQDLTVGAEPVRLSLDESTAQGMLPK